MQEFSETETAPWCDWMGRKSVNKDMLLLTAHTAECDISVLKLLGFETFPNFWTVSDSVLIKFGIEKSI